MSTRILLAATLLAGVAAPAAAQDAIGPVSDTETIRVLAAAQPACVVGSAAGRGGNNAAFTADGNGGGAVVISQLVDPQTAMPRASHIEIALPAICNSAHRLIIASGSGGLLREGGRATARATANQFGDLLPYAISYDWGTAQATTSSERGFQSIPQGAAQGELRLQIDTSASSDLLNAGRYTDTIVIRFEPGS